MPIDHVHALPPGTRFEEYRLDAVLGAGGFGITYRAYDANLDKFVAIKEYLPSEFATRAERYTVVPQSSTDAQDYHWGLNRFLDEARTLARFDHPHLNKVYRFFESNGTAYMVLEYIDGETLADRLTRERQLPEEALQRLLEEVLSGLAVMHAAGYVHRDIKPGNLMLREEDGSAVVLDFGAARQAVGQRSKAITSILTPGYAPVEQYDGKVDRVGAWTDIYALGMVAYRCISGITDSELPDAVSRMLAHTRGEAVLLSATEAGKGKFNTKFLEAIEWAMEVDEGDRPQSVDAWRGALAGQSRRQGSAKSVRKPITQPTRGTTTGSSGPSWSGVALTVVIVAMLGVGSWWGIQEFPELFGQGSDDTQRLAQQAATIDVPGETLQETESGGIGEAVARTEHAPSPEKTEAEQPASKEPALSPEEAEVARLLAAAEADLKARRLTSPVGNNAWDRYQQVLKLQPTNLEAIAGMERVIGSYMELFSASVGEEDFDKAENYLAKIGNLHPDSPVLGEGEQHLEAAKQARADRLAEQERQRQADEAARLAELERQRITEAIEANWEAFETAIQAEDLSEAAAILAQVRELNPEDQGLVTGEQRLAEAEQQQAWDVFEEALDEDDFDMAAIALAFVRNLSPNASDLVEREQRLADRRAAFVVELAGEMVDIPGGTFQMGDLSGDGDDDEKPVHSVTVPAFSMGKYEVTVGQFQRFVEATEYHTDAERNADGNEGCYAYTAGEGWSWTWGRSWRRPGYSVGDDQPVACVSWNDAQAFIAWLTQQTGESYRLPTEGEWEYAARAGSTTKYHFGDRELQLCHFANHGDTSTDFSDRNKSCSDGVGYRTTMVGRYQPNSFGLYDMHGNLWELVQDCYNESYAEAPINGSAWTSGNCDLRVIRGGSWGSSPGALRSANRGRSRLTDRNTTRGFRLAQDQ